MGSKLQFLLFYLLLISLSSAFESDELLLDEVEFEGPLRPDPPAPKRRPSAPSPDSKSIEFSLEHSFGNSIFSPAGTFSARLKSHPLGPQTLTKLRFSRNSLTDEERKKFEELIKEDGFYTIRLPSNVLDATGREYVKSTVRARCIPRESLDEHFVLHTDGVNILAVNYGSAGACQYPRPFRYPSRWSFNSYTVLKNGEQAPRTPTFAEELITSEEQLAEGVKPPEKTFWAKYWMYLIPLGLIVMNLMGQGMNMPEEGTGQAGGQGNQVAAQRATGGGGPRRR